MLPQSWTDRFAFGGLALGAVAAVACLGLYWGLEPGNSDRFLILLGAAWAAKMSLPEWRALPVTPWPWLGTLLIFPAVVLFAPPLYLVSQIGPRPIVLWWLASCWLLATAGFTLARYGYPRLRAAAFPLVFLLFALPIPQRVLMPLQEFLQNFTTTLSYHVFKFFGMVVERKGFVLELAAGRLGVEEACSGVRSITALTAIAAFIAYLRGFGPVRGTLLFAISIPVVASVNVIRVVASGLIQEAFGQKYIQDEWHEALGFALIFVGLGMILLVAKLLGPSAATVPVAEPNPQLATSRLAWAPACVILVGAILSLGAVGLGRYRINEKVASAPLEKLALTYPGWTGSDKEIPKVVHDLLRPDNAVYRVFKNNVGQDVHVWAFYWGNTSTMLGYHHPDICWNNKGFQPTTRWQEMIQCPGTGTVSVTAREFKQASDRQIVFYWTQEGQRLWTEADDLAAQDEVLTAQASHQWIGHLLGTAPSAEPRLQVVVIVPNTGTTARKDATAISKLIAEDLYTLCPWARPAE